jgi:autotransporter-associated beta strand protein
MAQNLSFMQQVLPQLDSRSYVERYAWWNWSSVSNLVVDPLPLTTTSLGDYWTGTTYATGQTFDLKSKDTGYDIYYLKGGTVTNTAPSGLDVMRRLDVVSGTGTITGAGRWDLADELLRVRNGATLRKMGSPIIGLKGIAVENAGTVAVNEGTLQFEDGSTSTGSGVYRVESGATLAFATRTDSAPNSITNAIELRGGTIRSVNGTQILASNINFMSASTLHAIGRLDLTGVLSGSAQVSKTGAGILRITNRSASATSGLITVADGTLFLDKAGSNVTGTSPILVQPAATLAGAALISGAVTVQGTLSPGVPETTGASELRLGSSLALQPGSRTVMDLTIGGFDRVTGTDAITLGGTLQLRPAVGLNPTTLTPLNIISGATISGHFELIEGISLVSGKALAVLYTPTSVQVMAALLGDATLDDSVGFDDLLIVAQNYESPDRSWSEGDFNGDRLVGFDDLLALAQNYIGPVPIGSLPSTFMADWALARSLVPEPVTALPLLTLIVGSLRRARLEENP